MTMTKWIGAFLVALFVSFSANAQSVDEGKVIIKYDPLFWKEQLRLSPAQYAKIKQINYDYYQRLLTAYSSKASSGAMHVKVEEYLELRSAQIWDTFQPRQKRKWLKLWGETPDHKNG